MRQRFYRALMIGAAAAAAALAAFGAAAATPIMEQTETEATEEIPAKKYMARYVDEDVARHSVASPEIEVRRWMVGLNEDYMATEQERTMVRQFKELNAALNVAEHAIREQTEKIRKLEAKGENITAHDRYQIQKAQNIRKNYEAKREALQAKMERVTGEKGYARLMKEQLAALGEYERMLGEVSYWLRSPDFTEPHMQYVYPDGGIGVKECIGYSGVRLMVRIKK